MTISRRVAWCSWIVISIFYAYQYVLRVMPNVMLVQIMEQFNIDAGIYGQFSGSYYIGYCLMHLPIGILLDKYGPKKIIPCFILLTVLGLLPIIFSNYWVYSIIGRFLIGIGSSAAILGAFKIIRITFDEKHFTTMLSFSVTIGLIGAIYGNVPLSYLSDTYGHKKVIEILAIFGLLFAFITYFLVPEIEEEKSTVSVTNGIKTVLTNPKVLAVCFLAGIMVGPMEGFADAWGSAFLKQVYGYEANSANYFTSMVYLGLCFSPFLSYFIEKTGAYIETIALSGFIMFLIFLILILGLFNEISLYIAFFTVGLCCSYQIFAIYKASTYVDESLSGLTTAVANMIIMSFGYIFHSLIGLVVKAYSEEGKLAYTYGISVVPITLIIGVVGFCVIAYKEHKTIS